MRDWEDNEEGRRKRSEDRGALMFLDVRLLAAFVDVLLEFSSL